MFRILTVPMMKNTIKEEVLKYLLRETGWLAHIHPELTFSFPWKRTYPATLPATDGHAILFWSETKQKSAGVIWKIFASLVKGALIVVNSTSCLNMNLMPEAVAAAV